MSFVIFHFLDFRELRSNVFGTAPSILIFSFCFTMPRKFLMLIEEKTTQVLAHMSFKYIESFGYLYVSWNYFLINFMYCLNLEVYLPKNSIHLNIRIFIQCESSKC